MWGRRPTTGGASRFPSSPWSWQAAILAALDDAGLTVEDLDGFALYSMGLDTSLLAQWLGVPEIRFTGLLAGGGGGSAGSIGLAAAAIVSGMAECVVSVMTLQQAASRFGASAALRGKKGAVYAAPSTPEGDFVQTSGLMAPGQLFALVAQRHMHRYGTTREHFAEVAISTRANAVRRESALMREPLTLDDYFGARMISTLCLYDFCLECDGAVAVVTTSVERARTSATRRSWYQGRPTAARAAGARRSPGSACRTSTSRRQATGRWPAGCTRWRVWGRTTWTSP